MTDLTEIKKLLVKHRISDYGFARLKSAEGLQRYRDWLDKGWQAEMSFLERHYDIKADPSIRYPQAESAIVLRFDYFPLSEDESPPTKALRLARYARQKDYHTTLEVKLEPLLQDLKKLFPNESFWFCTDSSPVLERDLARRAGLGWFGKNSCLIDSKKGSLFFIAEILTSLILPSAQVIHPDRCGHCTRCIDACPTGALDAETRTMKADLCIAYLNIEKKGLPPENLRAQMGDWFFGCDICQSVCPWNEKAFGVDLMNEPKPLPESLKAEIKEVLCASDDELKNRFKYYPLLRAKPKGLRRNAILVAANEGLKELLPEVSAWENSPDLGELARWAVSKLRD